MWHRRLRAAAVLATGVIAGSAAGTPDQDLLTGFAPRCLTSELQVSGASRDMCEPPPAVFGLTGPAILSPGGVDVEATGSVSVTRTPQDAKTETERTR